MGTRFTVFALLVSLIVQSILTIGCGAESLSLPASDEVQIVAIDLSDSASAEDYCTRCGGPLTATGCCAHGLPLTAAIVEVPRPSSSLSISAVVALPVPERNPSSLFRPPIPA